ncbi:unnamed protein product [Enterobius vermicularis]|uniref:Pre-mRNA-processing-splicing factor 8 n=1 Tax=Enterobius vermicularis TaxID=51028 RepID=A0A0N4V9W9_ENTVE|nr:unnamed protein product [Enterobius vermicularis]
MRASIESIFRWLSQTTFPASARIYEIDDSEESGADTMMIDLMVEQVQSEVVQLEKQKEAVKIPNPAKKRTPDYSWLISKSLARHRKYLSFQEKLTVETICTPIKRNEWANLIMTWRAKIQGATDRNQIIEALKQTVDETILSRPKKHSFGDILMNYIRHRQSLNSVGDESPRTEAMELEAVQQNNSPDRYADLARIV